MPHIARDLIRLRPMTTCSVEGDHDKHPREILVCWVRQKAMSSTLQHEEGTLHDLLDHDNIGLRIITTVRCDDQAKVHHGVLAYLDVADNCREA